VGTGIVSGVNWSVDGKVFSIFGLRGYVDGLDWIVPSGIGSMLERVKPAPVADRILDIIAEDERNGKAREIAYIGVERYFGLRLALEGVVTVEALSKARETPSRIICTVVIGGVERLLVIFEEASYSMATYDTNHEIV